MSMQPIGLDTAQADAVRALSHMSQAVEASEDRVQRANDGVIQGLRTALEQSENNNQLLSERIAGLNERVTQLEQTRAQLEQAHQAERQASEERFRTLTARIDALAKQLNEKTKETETNLEILRRQYQAHTHNTPGPCYGGHVIPTGGPIGPSAEAVRNQMREEESPSIYRYRGSDKSQGRCTQQ